MIRERRRASVGIDDANDVAIVGMACLFPGAPDLESYWHNILSRYDAISEPPPDMPEMERFFEANSSAEDRIYCKRGGFLGPLSGFDPAEYGVMPSSARGGEPDQWLALKVAHEAFADAGYRGEIAERHRAAVVLGKGNYPNRGNLAAAQHGPAIDEILSLLGALHPEFTPEDFRLVKEELQRQVPPFRNDTVPGLIPNITAGRIANRLDLMGPSYTVDAACASSLIALGHAVGYLRSGECDLALVGGVHAATPLLLSLSFCRLGALSHRQEIRPFDGDADGTILGEGV
ncbi:MAG TPA: polyketide synthase, partial [Isosphaeraceae bacterium]